MRILSRRLWAAGLIVAALSLVLARGLRAADPPAAGDVQLKVVKYGELVEAVKALRGKVVVVDVWALY